MSIKAKVINDHYYEINGAPPQKKETSYIELFLETEPSNS